MGAVTAGTGVTTATISAALAKLGPIVGLVTSVAGLGWPGIIAAAVLLLSTVGIYLYLTNQTDAAALAQTQADQTAAQAGSVQASQSVEQPQQAGHDAVTALEGDGGAGLPKRPTV